MVTVSLYPYDETYKRNVTIFTGDVASPSRLFLFLDAEFYLERMETARKIPQLNHPQTAFAFVSHIDNAHRHQDYICNRNFASYLVETVVAEIRQRFPTIRETGHFTGGLSLSGLASAHLLSVFPDTFDGALCQSGSFWWNDEWLTGNMPETTGKRIYLSVGDREIQTGLSHQPSGMRQETSQLNACQRFANRMKAQSNQVKFELFQGGHDLEPWAGEWLQAVDWMLL